MRTDELFEMFANMHDCGLPTEEITEYEPTVVFDRTMLHLSPELVR